MTAKTMTLEEANRIAQARIAELEQARGHWQAKYQAQFDGRCKAEDQLANLRDERRVHFAGLAMQGLCAHQYGPPDWYSIAKNAAHVADMLIAELQGGEKDD